MLVNLERYIGAMAILKADSPCEIASRGWRLWSGWWLSTSCVAVESE